MKRLFTAILLISGFIASAQTDTLKKPGFKFQSVGAVYGGFWGGLFNVSRADVEAVSNSALTDTDMNFNNYYNEWNNVTVWGNFDVLKRPSEVYQTVGLGLGYYNSTALGYSWGKDYRQTIDTLFSNTNHTYALVDSFYYHSKMGWLSTSNLMVHANYKVSSNPKRKFSFFATAGLGIGGAITSRYVFEEYTGSNIRASGLIDTLNPGNNNSQFFYPFGYNWQGTFTGTSKTVPGYFVLKPYITAGVNYRLSKYINVLKHMSLTLEVRVGSQHLFFKDRVFSGFSSGMAVGLNYTFM